MGVGDKIREIRLAKNVGLRELARALPVSHATLAEYENGKSRVDVDMLVRIAEALGESPCVFFAEGSAFESATTSEAMVQRAANLAAEAVRDEVRAAVREELESVIAGQGRLPRLGDTSTRYGASRQEMMDTFGQVMARQWDQLSEEKQRRILEIAEEAEQP